MSQRRYQQKPFSPSCPRIHHDRRRKFVGLGISVGISVLLKHWDFEKQQPTADCPDRAEIQFQITSKIREYEKKIKKLEVLEIPVTFDTLFEQNGKRINCTVGEYFKQIIERLEKVEKYSSASKHKVTLVLVSQFRSVNMRFDELDLTCLREFEIFLSQKGNVNNSCNYAAFQYCRLYLIEIPHQTTTRNDVEPVAFPLYLIEIPHQTTTSLCLLRRIRLLYLIEIPHQTTTGRPETSHARPLYLIEIPHQTTTVQYYDYSFPSCILSKFHIKPQPARAAALSVHSCILSKFHIKPQRSLQRHVAYFVVSYRNSTSNHNFLCFCVSLNVLYLIEIPHQTTTLSRMLDPFGCCILSKFHIKPQLLFLEILCLTRCILSKFHIKPQHFCECFIAECVVSYRNSTSNHNHSWQRPYNA